MNGKIDRAAIAASVRNMLGDKLTDEIPMILGNPATLQVEVDINEAESPGYVWVHGAGGVNTALTGNLNEDEQDKQGAVMALLTRDRIPKELIMFGAPVVCAIRGGVLRVIGLNGLSAAEFFYGLSNHPQASVVLSQFDVGLIRPTNPASGKVTISPFPIVSGETVYRVPALLSIDLIATYEPGLATGTAKAVLIEIDFATNTIYYTASAAFANDTHDNAWAAYYPKTITSPRTLRGWVKIYDGMRVIAQADILAAQEVYNKPDVSAAAVDAQILAYFNRVVFDSCGEIVRDEFGNIIFAD